MRRAVDKKFKRQTLFMPGMFKNRKKHVLPVKILRIFGFQNRIT